MCVCSHLKHAHAGLNNFSCSNLIICFLICLFYYQNEVSRAIELREIVTSLGPAYIKLGQALSIRPDILSPVAMIELQKLCDKVELSCRHFFILSL